MLVLFRHSEVLLLLRVLLEYMSIALHFDILDIVP